jgi:6-phosphofructokinase
MSQSAQNAVIAQSGGPTVVINASLVGVIEAIQETGLAGLKSQTPPSVALRPL